MKPMMIYSPRSGLSRRNKPAGRGTRRAHRSGNSSRRMVFPLLLAALSLTPLFAEAMIGSQSAPHAESPLGASPRVAAPRSSTSAPAVPVSTKPHSQPAEPAVPAAPPASEPGGASHGDNFRAPIAVEPDSETTAQPRKVLSAEILSPDRVEIIRQSVPDEAQQYLGVPYSWGGTTPKGFDCSGLVHFLYAQHGIELPRRSSAMFRSVSRISSGELKKGDLVFFRAPDHVGIYLGDDRFIHASSGGRAVTIDELGDAHYRRRFIGAGRVDHSSLPHPTGL